MGRMSPCLDSNGFQVSAGAKPREPARSGCVSGPVAGESYSLGANQRTATRFHSLCPVGDAVNPGAVMGHPGFVTDLFDPGTLASARSACETPCPGEQWCCWCAVAVDTTLWGATLETTKFVNSECLGASNGEGEETAQTTHWDGFTSSPRCRLSAHACPGTQ